MLANMSLFVVCLGRTPITWFSRPQGAIASSTYHAEFSAMRTAVEEAISLRYTLLCFGTPVTDPAIVMCDNLGVIQSACIEDSLLKKNTLLFPIIPFEKLARLVLLPL